MTDSSPQKCETSAAQLLLFVGVLSSFGYVLLSWLSWRFTVETPADAKPTLWVLFIIALEFLCYFVALTLVVRQPANRRLLGGIMGSAIAFRAILLPSIPIHEIDIYRYIWDGAVIAEGVSPYRYSPKEVIAASYVAHEALDEDLRRLVLLQANDRSLAYSLHQIHFGELPSPYPFVSEAVFAVADTFTPSGASHYQRMVGMKCLLILFDLATLLIVINLLSITGVHPGLSLTYGWCPLVLKEIANSGHLDPIAIFFTTLAIRLLVKSCLASSKHVARSSLTATAMVGLTLASAVGAKLYPLVLLPLFVTFWWRKLGIQAAIVGLATTLGISLMLFTPMFWPREKTTLDADVAEIQASVPHLNLPGQSAATSQDSLELRPVTIPTDPAAGISAFLKQWEMNDLIFMVVVENLRSQENVAAHVKPWFVFLPERWAHSAVTTWSSLLRWGSLKLWLTDQSLPTKPIDSKHNMRHASFLLARVITGSLFLLIACCLAWRAAGQEDPAAWCRAGMLTLAWFWLTCPTQNPWYWCWVLPLLPFARYRAWYAVAPFTMLYYLRFWLSAQYTESPMMGTPYDGEHFFYFVVPWIEYAPCLLALAVEWQAYRRKGRAL